MKTARLNGSLRVSRITAERNLADLERIYSALIVQAGRQAAAALVASTRVTLTAAADQPPNWQPPPEGVLFNATALAARALKRLAKLHTRILRQSAQPTLARAGIAWDITHPLSQALLDAAGQRTGQLLTTGVQPALTEIIAGAYAEGLPVRDTALLIKQKIGEAAPGQAQMLARTDLNSLSNGGSVMAAQMVGAQYKQWITAGDDRVRETHVDADGQTVPIDQPFDVGGEQLDYPGDPAGSDEEVANCRCSLIYVDGPEAETASARPQPPLSSSGMVARIPTRGFAAAVTITVNDAPDPMASTLAWESTLAFEDMEANGIYFLPGCWEWRDLPLTLMAMTETAEGHDGAEVAGRIDSITRRGNAIPGEGIFDSGDYGAMIARMVGEETLRGVSVDYSLDEWTLRDPATGDLIDPATATPDQVERAIFGELQTAAVRATIMAATVCPTPAFADARIALAASASSDGQRVLHLWAPIELVGAEPLTASAAGLAPDRPPAEWFATPEAAEPTPLTVTADGRVFGHMALWESCHVGYPGQCVPPPRSPSGYAYFNLGEVECDDGSRVACGAITLEALHADKRLSAEQAQAHYLEHTGVVGAYVRASDGKHGIWVSGALRASLPARYARDLMGAKPSGDWRQTRPGGPLEMIGVHAVNEPGFPVPRLVASALLPSGARAELMFAEPAAA